jgi:peptidoglycan/LPS O-acetylase OafA/YrhL
MTPHGEGAERIVYIDGLRGIAVGMVMIFHAWWDYPSLIHPSLDHPRTLAEGLLVLGNQGVSLFLVISGFCLAFPAMQRHAAGEPRWFTPRVFFARRALRILPPYYGALALFVGVSLVIAHVRWPELSVVGPPPSPRSLLAHLLLVHNLTYDNWSINGSFWSLALEWQWYWAFPLVLVLCARSPRLALGLCVALAVVWHVGAHDLWDIGAVPARLFEFCCGVAAARLVVRRTPVSRFLLVLGAVMAFVAVQVPPLPPVSHVPLAWLLNHVLHPIATLGLAQPLWGIVFACLLLLGHYSRVVNAILSWRPLVALGIASYSVYLIHEPVVQAVETYVPAATVPALLAAVAALACGMALGIVFHICIERPCMRRSTWQRLAPLLVRLFAWTDALWVYVVGKSRRSAALPAERVASSAER